MNKLDSSHYDTIYKSHRVLEDRVLWYKNYSENRIRSIDLSSTLTNRSIKQFSHRNIVEYPLKFRQIDQKYLFQSSSSSYRSVVERTHSSAKPIFLSNDSIAPYYAMESPVESIPFLNHVELQQNLSINSYEFRSFTQ